MKTGSELIAAVTSRVNVVLQKIKKILIGAYQGLKRIVLVSLKGLQQLVKKKREGAKGKQVVSNTKAAKVKRMSKGGVVAKGCGKILSNRRKRTKGSVSRL